ncbi:MAG: hypothetical protein ACK5EN_16735, partial [Planctomyces sp.]
GSSGQFSAVEGWEMSGWRLLSRCLSAGVFVCVTVSVGCDDGRPVLVEASGRVLLQGQGVTAGSVTFHPDSGNEFQGDSPSSQLQLDGSFRMKTFPWGEGVAVGRYRATLSAQLAERLGLPEYADPAKSPLQLEVTSEGLRGYVIELPGAAGGQSGQTGTP